METAEIIDLDVEISFLQPLQKKTEDPFNATELTHTHPTTQILLTTKPPIHLPEAGLNPLVDAASYLFSWMGKLRHTKHYHDLAALQTELIKEIANFRETIHSYRYNAEYLVEYNLISCYALSMTLDNIITNTSWGDLGKWDQYSLVTAINQESLSHESILIILERMVCDPGIYIDVMEFMYICLSLGLTFKQSHATLAFSHEQLEQITYSLYKRIRAHRSNYSKILTPFSIKPSAPTVVQTHVKKKSPWLRILLITSFLACGMAGGKLWINYQHASAPQMDFDIK